MNITIMGCGRWGSFLAWYFSNIGFNVLLWGRKSSPRMAHLLENRKNEFVVLPNAVGLSFDIERALSFSEDIVIAIEAQRIGEFLTAIKPGQLGGKNILLAMKGFDGDSHRRLSEVVSGFISDRSRVAVLVGPGHPKEITAKIPTCMLIDSLNEELKNRMVHEYGSGLIMMKAGHDIIGNEISAAAKNVLGIAAGILDGIGYQSLKGCLMVIGLREISRFIKGMGGKPETAYGLACLGDFQATMFSEQSNSINYGCSVAKKTRYNKHVPGKYTARSIAALSRRYNIDLPLFKTVYEVLYYDHDIVNITKILFEHQYEEKIL